MSHAARITARSGACHVQPPDGIFRSIKPIIHLDDAENLIQKIRYITVHSG